MIGATYPVNTSSEMYLSIYRIIDDAALGVNNASDDILFYDYQMEILRGIANQCPYEYGDAVYLARLLLSRIEPTVFHNECEDIIEQRKHDKVKVEVKTPLQVAVYPNPARDEFYVEFTGDLSGKSTIVELYDLYGKMVKQVRTNNETKFTVSTFNLTSGIYFYKISVDNMELKKDKLVIIK
jgi:hypothetical protein